jgi:hypothetical protein
VRSTAKQARHGAEQTLQSKLEACQSHGLLQQILHEYYAHTFQRLSIAKFQTCDGTSNLQF